MKSVAFTVLAAAAVLAAGCGRKPPAPTVHASMTEVVAPQAQTIWDITNRSFNKAGDGLDPSKISPADWIKLDAAGRQLSDRARVLAKARNVTAAAPGAEIMGDGARGAPTVQQIQAFIDADRAGFAEHARILAKAGDTVAKAAKAKDVAPLFRVASGLDEVCDGCHEKYWGSDQPPQAAVAAALAARK